MKRKIISLLVAPTLLLCACKKNETREYVTSFTLNARDYLSKDTLPNFNFKLEGVYTYDYNFSSQTNDYGNFDTVFSHLQETNFDCNPISFEHFLATTTGQVKGGNHSVVLLEVLRTGQLIFNLDCSGIGYIQNLKHERVTPISSDISHSLNSAATGTTLMNPNCNFPPTYAVFSGDWIISYQHKINSTAPWTEVSDTITVLPSEDYIYTIYY